MNQTIDALENAIKKVSCKLSYSSGQYQPVINWFGWYQTFYLKQAYWIDNNNVKIAVPVAVDFLTSTSQGIITNSIFSDGLGLKLQKPFSTIRLSCYETIAGNPDIYIDYYIANGDIIDNLNYVSGSLNVNVQNFPDAVSSALNYQAAERLIADKSNDKTVSVDAVLGLNSYEIYTANVAGDYINAGVKTSLLITFSNVAPTTIGRFINRLAVSPRLTVNTIDGWDNPPVVVRATFVNPLWPNVPLELRNTGTSRLKVGTNMRMLSLSDYVYDVAPLKIEDTQIVIDFYSYQRAICEGSRFYVSLNII